MANKTNKKSAEKNQSESFDRDLDDLRKSVKKDMKKMGKLDFADFKKELTEYIEDLYSAVFTVAEELATEKRRLNEYLDIIVEKTKERDKLLDKVFEVLSDREAGISSMVFWLSCKSLGRKVTREDRENISEAMGFKWTPENEKRIQAYVGGNLLS